MRRYELSDQQWAILEPFFPPTHSGHAGHPWSEHRPIVNGILWILHTGAAWRDLPERYGPFQTVHDRFTRWRSERNLMERMIGWFKLHRRLATRYEKLAVNFLTFWTVAWITLLLKHLLSDTP